MLSASLLTLMSMFSTPVEAPMSIWIPETLCAEVMSMAPAGAEVRAPLPVDWCTAVDGMRDPRCSSLPPAGVPPTPPKIRPRVDMLAGAAPSLLAVQLLLPPFVDDTASARAGMRSRIDRPPIV